jgi:hypothetical protein
MMTGPTNEPTKPKLKRPPKIPTRAKKERRTSRILMALQVRIARVRRGVVDDQYVEWVPVRRLCRGNEPPIHRDKLDRPTKVSTA